MNQKEFSELYASEAPIYKAWASFVLSEIKSELRKRVQSPSAYDEWIKIPPTQRIKTVDSLVSKAFIRKKDKYNDPYNEITDKAGIRFVVLLTSQLSMMCEIVESSDYWTNSKDKDFDDWKDDNPRIFDYQSVHYIVRASQDIDYQDVTIPEGMPCEVQLRTLLQHAYAELAHDTVYKSNVPAAPEIHRAFAKSMALMETTDDLLCSAKETLDNLTANINEWRQVLNREAEARLTGVALVDDFKDMDFVLSSLDKLLTRVSYTEMIDFLDKPEFSYIPDRIKVHEGESIEFRHPFILLVYFLSRRFQRILHNEWPLDLGILEKVYSDLGQTPSWAVT